MLICYDHRHIFLIQVDFAKLIIVRIENKIKEKYYKIYRIVVYLFLVDDIKNEDANFLNFIGSKINEINNQSKFKKTEKRIK